MLCWTTLGRRPTRFKGDAALRRRRVDLTSLRGKKKKKREKRETSVQASPVKSLFKVLPRDVKLEDGPLAVGGSVITPTVLFKESIKAVLGGVLLAAHEHH